MAKHQTEDVAQVYGLREVGEVGDSPNTDRLQCERDKLGPRMDEGMDHHSTNSRISPTRKSFAMEGRPDC